MRGSLSEANSSPCMNAILLINHEIDSAFWKEWELFKLPCGINGFLILHFPILFLILCGLVLVYKQSFLGLIVSLILGAGGIFAFGIHMIFIRKGRHEFNTPISRIILTQMLLVSALQAAVTIYLLLAWINLTMKTVIKGQILPRSPRRKRRL
jgi:hypothetical protein